MKAISRTLVGTIAAVAVAASLATPATARDGGFASVGVSVGHYGDYDNQRGGFDRGDWGRGDFGRGDFGRGFRRGNPRAAVEQCVRTTERTAARVGNGRANVTDIRDVRQTGRGYEVRGRIAVNTIGRDWRDSDRGYGDRDYGRGWNSPVRGYDSGSFKCRIEYGRVVDIDYDGIRGL